MNEVRCARHVKSVSPFIDGVLVDSASDRTLDVIDPSTGRHAFAIPAGAAADAERAVAAARHAFEDGRWSEAAPSFRKGALSHLAVLLKEHAAQLDALDAGEMGKPVSEALFNATAAAGLMEFCA